MAVTQFKIQVRYKAEAINSCFEIKSVTKCDITQLNYINFNQAE